MGSCGLQVRPPVRSPGHGFIVVRCVSGACVPLFTQSCSGPVLQRRTVHCEFQCIGLVLASKYLNPAGAFSPCSRIPPMCVVCVYIHMQPRMCICLRVCVCLYGMCTYLSIYLSVFYIYLCTCTYVCVHVYMYMHRECLCLNIISD